jgi:ribosomal protein S12 methylthiotransferase
MIRALADCQHVVKYIDMPLQHINDQVLQAMRRKVIRRETLTLLDKLRKWVPGITLRTTLISGFPGETDEHHAELVAFVKDFGFDCLGVFEYSPEPGTPAGRLWESRGVPAAVAAARKEEIMLAQQAIALAKNQALVGQTLDVLVDEVDAKSRRAVGRHRGQAPDIDGRVVIEKAKLWPGQVVPVRITGCDSYDLAGRVATAAVATDRTARGGTGRGKLSLPVMGIAASVEGRGKRV